MLLEASPFSTPELDLKLLEDGHVVIVYSRPTCIGVIKMQDHYPEAKGPAMVLWQLRRKTSRFHDNDLVVGEDRFDTGIGRWKAIAYSPLDTNESPMAALVPLVDRFRPRPLRET